MTILVLMKISPKACIEPKVEGRPVRFVERFRPDNLDDCPEVARGLDGREAGLLSKMGAPWVQIHSDGDQDSILPEAKRRRS